MNSSFIEIKGARQHNLRNFDLKIPKAKFSVVTGPSGSGKSSLAFNTLYAEGQRRYIESLSAYARQFLEKHEKPDVDDILGLSPTIAIEQKNSIKSSRSTVGTATEIYDYLRLVFSKMGKMYCPETNELVKKDAVTRVCDQLQKDHKGQRAYFLFPYEFSKTSKIDDRRRALEAMLENAFSHTIDATALKEKKKCALVDVEEALKKKKIPLLGRAKSSQQIFILADKLLIEKEERGRVEEAMAQCYAQGFGRAFCAVVDDKNTITNLYRFTEYPSVGDGSKRFPEMSPNLFSFNSPMGACEICKGFGHTLQIDPKLVIPNPDMSISQGAIEPFSKPSMKTALKDLFLYCQENKINTNLPWKLLKKKDRDKMWQGDADYEGVETVFKQLEENRYKVEVRVFLSRYRSPRICPDCVGKRLKTESLHVFFHKKNIADLSALTIEELHKWFNNLKLTKNEKEIGKEVFVQIDGRLDFLLQVGLDYLSLGRLAKTLSGGEAQRIALANQLASRLTQTTYVLDEPSIGLHPRDTFKLVEIMKRLTDLKNTVVVVEHDPDIIKQAEYLVDIGPGAGQHGGELLYSGDYKDFKKAKLKGSSTQNFLSGKDFVPVPLRRRVERFKDQRKKIEWLEITECEENNLQKIDVKIPRELLTCITGVSGSGKSSAIRKTLYPALARTLLQKAEVPGAYKRLSGYQGIRSVKLINQDPIGKSPRSNPITFIKSFDDVRHLFASTKDARKHRFHSGHFSFNVPGGRCDHCSGDGFVRVEMVFMEDIFLKCEHCQSKRYKKQVLNVRYKEKNIHDVLQMTVVEAKAFFAGERRLARNLGILEQVGLGYLKLGQPSNTLSGGECQRLKIAREFLSSESVGYFYVLDEPTTGLHFRDVKILIKVLHDLVERGNTVVVIEHNTEMMKAADWVIDFGPGGGVHGGQIVCEGEPEKIAKSKKSATAPFLKAALKDAPKSTLTKFLESGMGLS